MTGRSKAFTLTELLIAMLIVGIIAGATIGLLVTYLKQFEQSTELTAARQRGEMVFAILDAQVLHSGLGMPDETAAFQSAFAGLGAISGWNAPVSVTSGDVLQIVYAVPAGLAVTAEYELQAGTSQNIGLTGPIPANLLATGITCTKGWAIFPSLGNPVKVTGISGSTLTILPTVDGHLAFFDELHYIRAERVTISGEHLYTEDVTNQSAQPRLEGIADLRFQWDASSRLLRCWVLARGDVRHNDLISPATLSDWPWGTIPDEQRHYRLTVVQSVWRVRN